MEYVSGGLLFDVVMKLGPLSDDHVRYFAWQLVESLEYLHETEQIVHRDLKLENILLDENKDLKIVDFGACSTAENHNIDCLDSYAGTKSYMAPEIREGKVYNGKQVDLFSVGVILYIMR